MKIQLLSKIGISETEKNRFNAKFELLKGEKLKLENIDSILNSISNNIEGVQVISNTQIKILVSQKETKNEDTIKMIQEWKNKQKTGEYNLKIEYNQENGLAEKLDIQIITDNK